MKVDYLIVGQGLAGSAMALSLRDLGASVMVIDREKPNSASRVAAGLVTTLAGKGMNPSWRQEEYLPEAMEYYRKLEKLSGRKLFHDMELLKLFHDEKQRAKFERKKGDVSAWHSEAKAEDLSEWESPQGGFIMEQGGWLDTNTYLEIVQEILGDSYARREFDADLLELESDGVRYEEISAKAVILCLGVDGLIGSNSRFHFLDHRSAKGEMLLVKIKGKARDKIISKNGWLVPVEDDLYKVGATYEWHDMQGSTTSPGRAEVEAKLITMLGNDDFEVVDHIAGVRPIVRKSQPMVGAHPIYPQVKLFNGLGSRGVITAPSVAKHFAEHLVDRSAIDPNLDVSSLRIIGPDAR